MSEQMKILDRWPEQETRGHTIPGSRYTSREFMEQEWEGMWTKVWLLLGREAEILCGTNVPRIELHIAGLPLSSHSLHTELIVSVQR